MVPWLNLGQQFKANAKKFPNTVAFKDAKRSFTYPETNARVNQLCHSLLSMGLAKGDKIAVLMENSVEICEIFLATAKTGLVIVPINFRLVAGEIEYIVKNSDAKTLIADLEFVPTVDQIRAGLKDIAPGRYISVGGEADGYIEYEGFIQDSAEEEPDTVVDPEDTWVLIYTSGTTGVPKGVVRSHESHVAFYLINAVDFGFSEHDICLNVMPLCHINSIFFTFIFTYIGGSVYIHPARSFKAGEVLETVERERITFISLIPTHYNIILNAAAEERSRDVSSIRKLLCSSAPVRKDMKLAILDFFKGVELYEGYGSTEAGIVTVLKPEDQIRKLGSIGFESLGTDFVKLMGEDGKEVEVGEVGELYSRGPMLFDEYYKMPERTADSFIGDWFSAGDMATVDNDGFYSIVDRKNNLIITGGEHVYPSEVEGVIGNHPGVFDVAIIGLPDEKWGERVTAVVVPKANAHIDEEAIIDFCWDKVARYKRPKRVIFITDDEMPRTLSGKKLHRALRERFGKEGDRS